MGSHVEIKFILYLKYRVLYLGLLLTPLFCSATTIKFFNLPLAMNYPNKLHEKLLQVQQQKMGQYVVRTEHKNADGSPQYVNRLILESSPYLLQHAHNPVNWYAWGDEAFATAKRLNLPVFLSIGYSTCHWCHVMEVESFDDLEVAKYLNQHFICIKVDREQRPDLDDIYMTAVQMFTGRGGWPMSNFLTSQAQPFYGGTYYPKQQFLHLLKQVTTAWQKNHAEIMDSAEQVTQQISLYRAQSEQAQVLDQAIINKAINSIVDSWDEKNGGFNFAPKFPNETHLLLLLDQLHRNSNPEWLKVVAVTLHKMAQGGIYDQVAGGFHRYSTDEKWLVPHFEKMLYNQALMGNVYTQAYRITGAPFYKRIAEEVFNYAIRDMQAKNGGFYSATDADSEGVEGVFYLWTIDEIKKVLPEQLAELAIKYYGITKDGNFENKNILHLKQSMSEFAQTEQIDIDQLILSINKIKNKLYQVREKRIHPSTDNKIITAWNGMMITSLVQASELLNKPDYLQQAIKSAEYLWQKHVNKTNDHLWRASLKSKSSIEASLEDYAYYAAALIQIYDSTQQKTWLQKAEKIADKMIELFADAKGGFYHSISKTKAPLIARIKSANDDAIPSGNAIAMQVLLELYNRIGKPIYKKALNAALSNFSGNVVQNPVGYTTLLRVVSKKNAGELGSRQYFSGGVVTAKISVVKREKNTINFVIKLSIKKGWHINSNHPLDEKLIAIQLTLGDNKKDIINSIQFPKPKVKKLSFQNQSMSLFEGNVSINGTIEKTSEKMLIPVKLKLQACSDRLCLLPESKVFTLFIKN